MGERSGAIMALLFLLFNFSFRRNEEKLLDYLTLHGFQVSIYGFSLKITLIYCYLVKYICSIKEQIVMYSWRVNIYGGSVCHVLLLKRQVVMYSCRVNSHVLWSSK